MVYFSNERWTFVIILGGLFNRDQHLAEEIKLTLYRYIERYGIHEAIVQAGYPETKAIGSMNAVLCFIKLIVTDVARYSCRRSMVLGQGDRPFCKDECFAQSSLVYSYSHRITIEMNRRFLTALHHNSCRVTRYLER